jgi:hypothetical protein
MKRAPFGMFNDAAAVWRSDALLLIGDGRNQRKIRNYDGSVSSQRPRWDRFPWLTRIRGAGRDRGVTTYDASPEWNTHPRARLAR